MSFDEPQKKEGPVWTYEDEKTRIIINRKWCKGCEICVEFCPKKTLAMDGDKVVVAALDTCSKCLLCEIRCPDFAIEVFDLTASRSKSKKAASAKEDQFPGEIEDARVADLEGPDMCYRGGSSGDEDQIKSKKR